MVILNVIKTENLHIYEDLERENWLLTKSIGYIRLHKLHYYHNYFCIRSYSTANYCLES